ncbi:hypothetical protein PH586_18035 [Pseudomonas sp. SA3-5]|uniref:Uncharacterized protein n=1 Tax=Pseudomonas aestuarii TaxID=3018340 RepID=A0ABT4XJJ1_9PSED|nr:hypothetical protein [Pseudomonas aestuarii]MDA7088288.1 hypothetical protein [Pseudomonas aestuarii]
MASHDNSDISLDDLALEPLAEQVGEEVSKGRAKYQIDTRGGGERRKMQERRADIRFQEERRSNKDRRVGSNPWAPGVDI